MMRLIWFKLLMGVSHGVRVPGRTAEMVSQSWTVFASSSEKRKEKWSSGAFVETMWDCDVYGANGRASSEGKGGKVGKKKKLKKELKKRNANAMFELLGEPLD